MTLFSAQWNPNGNFGIVKAIESEGGMHSYDWVTPTYADVFAALNALVPSARRVTGMLVTMRNTATSQYEQFYWDNSTWVRYAPSTAPGNWGIITGCAVSNPDVNTITIATGAFYQLDGVKVVVSSAVNLDISSLSGDAAIIWDASAGGGAGAFALATIDSAGSITFPDLVFGFVRRSGGFVTRFLSYNPRFNSRGRRNDAVVGSLADNSANFSALNLAVAWISAYDDDTGMNRAVRINDTFGIASTTSLGTASVTQSGANGNVVGSTTRYKRDLAVGDRVFVGATLCTVLSITDDVTMTVSDWPTPGTTVQSLTRADLTTAYGPILDLAQPEFAVPNVTSGFDVTSAIASELGSRVSVSTTLSYTPTRPLINLNGQPGWHVRGFDISCAAGGTPDPTTAHDAVFFKGLGPNTRIEDMVLTPNTLLHAFNFDRDLSGSGTGVELIDVSVMDLEYFTSCPFYVSEKISGKLRVRGGTYAGSSSSRNMDMMIQFAKDGTLLDYRFEDCNVRNVRYSVAEHHSGPNTHGQRFTRCKFGVNGTPASYFLARSARPDTGVVGISATVQVPTVTGTEATLTGLVFMSATDVGGFLELDVGSIGPQANQGTFLITEFISSSSVKIWHPTAVVHNSNVQARKYPRASTYGTTGSITANTTSPITGNTQTIDVGSTITGDYIWIAKAADPKTNGRFRIISNVGTTITYANPYGAGTDANNGAILWSVVNGEKIPRVEVFDCEFDTDMKFDTLAKLDSSRFVSARTYRFDASGLAITTVRDCDLSLGTQTANTGGAHGTTDFRGTMRMRADSTYLQRDVSHNTLEYLSALSGQYAGGRRQPIVGLELYPHTVANGANWDAYVRVQAGAATFPNGKVAYTTINIDQVMSGITTTDGLALSNYTQYYFFLRYVQAASAGAGVNVHSVVASTRPPQSDGRLNASDTPGGGSTAADYLYIGMMPFAEASSSARRFNWFRVRTVYEAATPYSRRRRVYVNYDTPDYTSNDEVITSDNAVPGVGIYDKISAPVHAGGAAASITSPSDGICTITGLTGMNSGHLNKIINLVHANDDVRSAYRIIEIVSATSVKVLRSVGASASSITWTVHNSINVLWPTAAKLGLRFGMTVNATNVPVTTTLDIESPSSFTTEDSDVFLLEVDRRLGTYKADKTDAIAALSGGNYASKLEIDYIVEDLMAPLPVELPDQGLDQ